MMEYIATREGVEFGSLNLNKEFEAMSNETEFNQELYLVYIATRKGVAIDEQQHGLFGRLSDMEDTGDIKDLSLTKGYVENLAHNKTTIYNAIISLSEDDAIEKELTSRSDWSDLVNNHIYNIARTMGIPPRTLEWVGAVHMEKGHPHVHIMYWDKEQKIGVNFIKPELANDIRKSITKDLYKDDFRAIMNQKDLLHNQLIDKIYINKNSVLKNVKHEFNNMSPSQVYKLSQNKKTICHILNRRIASRGVAELTDKLLSLSEQIKVDFPKGALKYQYLPEHLKKAIDEITKKTIHNNPDIAKEFNSYIDTAKSQAAIYGGKKNIADYANNAKKHLYKDIGNKILATIKELRTIQFSAKKELYNAELQQKINHYNQTMAMNMLQGIFDAVTQSNHVAGVGKNKKTGKDMSKAERADLLKKSKDISLEWGDQ